MYFFLKEPILANGTKLPRASLVLADYDSLSKMLDDYQKGQLFCSCKKGAINEEFVVESTSMGWPLLIDFLRGEDENVF